MRVLSIVVNVLVILLIFASIMYTLEAPAADGFENLFTFFYFAVVTVSTVGYGDFSPIKWSSRFVTVCTILVTFGFLPSQIQKLVYELQKPPKIIGSLPSDGDDFVLIAGPIHPIQLLLMCREIDNSLPGSCERVLVLTSLPAVRYKRVVAQALKRAKMRLTVKTSRVQPHEIKPFYMQPGCRVVYIVGNLRCYEKVSGDGEGGRDETGAVVGGGRDLASVEVMQEEEDHFTLLRFMAAQQLLWYDHHRPIVIQLLHGYFNKLVTEMGAYHVICINHIKMRLLGKSCADCPGFATLVSNWFFQPQRHALLDEEDRRSREVGEVSDIKATLQAAALPASSPPRNNGPEQGWLNRMGAGDDDHFSQYPPLYHNDHLLYRRGARFQVFRLEFHRSWKAMKFTSATRLIYQKFNVFLIGVASIGKDFYFNPVEYRLGDEMVDQGGGGEPVQYPFVGVVLAPSIQIVSEINRWDVSDRLSEGITAGSSVTPKKGKGQRGGGGGGGGNGGLGKGEGNGGNDTKSNRNNCSSHAPHILSIPVAPSADSSTSRSRQVILSSNVSPMRSSKPTSNPNESNTRLSSLKDTSRPLSYSHHGTHAHPYLSVDAPHCASPFEIDASTPLSTSGNLSHLIQPFSLNHLDHGGIKRPSHLYTQSLDRQTHLSQTDPGRGRRPTHLSHSYQGYSPIVSPDITRPTHAASTGDTVTARNHSLLRVSPEATPTVLSPSRLAAGFTTSQLHSVPPPPHFGSSTSENSSSHNAIGVEENDDFESIDEPHLFTLQTPTGTQHRANAVHPFVHKSQSLTDGGTSKIGKRSQEYNLTHKRKKKKNLHLPVVGGLFQVKSYHSGVGMGLFDSPDHRLVLVCGWPPGLRVFLETVQAAGEFNVIVLSPSPPCNLGPLELKSFNRSCLYVKGSAITTIDLILAGLFQAHSCSIFSTSQVPWSVDLDTSRLDAMALLAQMLVKACFFSHTMDSLRRNHLCQPPPQTSLGPITPPPLLQTQSSDDHANAINLSSATRRLLNFDNEGEGGEGELREVKHGSDGWTREGWGDIDAVRGRTGMGAQRGAPLVVTELKKASNAEYLFMTGSGDPRLHALNLQNMHHTSQETEAWDTRGGHITNREYMSGNVFIEEIIHGWLAYTLPISRYATDTAIIDHLCSPVEDDEVKSELDASVNGRRPPAERIGAVSGGMKGDADGQGRRKNCQECGQQWWWSPQLRSSGTNQIADGLSMLNGQGKRGGESSKGGEVVKRYANGRQRISLLDLPAKYSGKFFGDLFTATIDDKSSMPIALYRLMDKNQGTTFSPICKEEGDARFTRCVVSCPPPDCRLRATDKVYLLRPSRRPIP
eukprot:GHVN01073015.1.p1 GENE.GHVN01073015.1~~GHVN01073015.1.p1  ORF type:complete len:1337 (-),score=246.90 GHVN01073015.1:330-4340(-)